MKFSLKSGTVLITLLLLVGCKKESVADFEGSWVDKQNELQTILIETEKGQYVMRGYWGDYQLSIKDKRTPMVVLNGKEYPVVLDRRADILTFNGSQYIRESEALKPRFTGKWLDEQGQTHWIQLSNGMPIWDIYADDGTPQRYWPKFKDGKYTFIYNNEQLWFSLEGASMVDSKGGNYTRIE